MIKRIKTALLRAIKDIAYVAVATFFWIFIVIPFSMVNDTAKYFKSLWKPQK